MQERNKACKENSHAKATGGVGYASRQDYPAAGLDALLCGRAHLPSLPVASGLKVFPFFISMNGPLERKYG